VSAIYIVVAGISLDSALPGILVENVTLVEQVVGSNVPVSLILV
jgi:hypothetical protein